MQRTFQNKIHTKKCLELCCQKSSCCLLLDVFSGCPNSLAMNRVRVNVDGSKEVQYFQFRETLKFKNSKTCVGIYFLHDRSLGSMFYISRSLVLTLVKNKKPQMKNAHFQKFFLHIFFNDLFWNIQLELKGERYFIATAAAAAALYIVTGFKIFLMMKSALQYII